MPDIAPFETQFAHGIYDVRYKHPHDLNWAGTSRRVATEPMRALQARTGRSLLFETDRLTDLFRDRKAIAGGRYLYATGRDFHQVNNCVLLNCPDSREGWGRTGYESEMALMTGAGIGVWYGEVRPGGYAIKRTGGTASGPLPKMQQVNETGRHVMQGGNRRSAIWAGLPWWHADVFDFVTVKDWSDEVKALKAKDWNFPAPMDYTNISVTLDDAFFAAYAGDKVTAVAKMLEVAPDWMRTHLSTAPDGGTWTDWARRVYDTAVSHMLRHGEPGFSIDTGDKTGEVLRNACTEITSADDADVCNLGSLVLPRFDSPEEFGAAARDMVLFLTAGSVYSEVPFEKVAEVREKNRRLGLGLIGVHEFLIKSGVKYGTPQAFEVLEPYMREYARALEYAWDWQDKLNLTRSKGATAIAPNGTIGIVAESTPSADPMYAAAEIRQVATARHSGGNTYTGHVVVDPVAARLVREGVDPSLIEDAATLALQPERRLAQQAYLQSYTDHAISSTVNLPGVMTEPSEVGAFKQTLMEYLPDLRGITVYPNGARAGQPRTSVDLKWALEREGTILETDEETCVGGVCGV